MKEDGAKNLSQIQFGREAKKYVDSSIHSSSGDLKFIAEFIGPKHNWKVLDIATGAGHLALALAPHVSKVIASDITSEMLEEADKLCQQRGITNFRTKKIDVHTIPYQDEEFDLVTSRIAPHHFIDIEQAISEMVRICKPRGFIFIEDTIAPHDNIAAEIFNRIELLRDPSHIRDLSFEEWIKLLEKNKCMIIKHETKQKDWELKWWTERMSTPRANVEKIIEILNVNYEKYKDIIHIKREPGFDQVNLDKKILAWSLHPYNGYFLAQKQG